MVSNTKKFGSLFHLVNYVRKERDFWGYDNVNANKFVSSYQTVYDTFLSALDTADALAATTNESNFPDSQIVTVKQKIANTLSGPFSNLVTTCTISSASLVASAFLAHAKMPHEYFVGLTTAISSRAQQQNVYGSFTTVFLSGYVDGFALKKTTEILKEKLCTESEALKNTLYEVNNEATTIHERYEADYAKSTARMNAVIDDNDSNYKTQTEKLEELITEKTDRFNTLENVYDEKLRLSKPAEYWAKMSTKYRNSGIRWFAASIFAAFLLIAALLIIIIFVPNLFDGVQWFDFARNTAILTVMTSVGIYVLRVLIKLGMGSYHLSRDAKEREQLTYFYLSLINEKAIDPVERDLIIASLFSRSDTGLLKGDGGAGMPQINIATKGKDDK